MKFIDKLITIGALVTIMLAVIVGCIIVFTKELYNHFIPVAIILILVLIVIDHKYPETKKVGI